jgi:hypothetical protein
MSRSAAAFCPIWSLRPAPLRLAGAPRGAIARWTCAANTTATAAPAAAAAAAVRSRRHVLRALAVTAILPVLTCVPVAPAHALSRKRLLAKAGPLVVLPSGVSYRDIAAGKSDGNSPNPGDTVAIHYSVSRRSVLACSESRG